MGVCALDFKVVFNAMAQRCSWLALLTSCSFCFTQHDSKREQICKSVLWGFGGEGGWQESSWVALNTTTKSMIWAEWPWHLPDTQWASSRNHSITPLSVPTFLSFVPRRRCSRQRCMSSAGSGPVSFLLTSTFLISYVPLLENFCHINRKSVL